LIELIDPPLHDVVSQQLFSIKDTTPTGQEATTKLLESYRELGTRLAAFYGSALPAHISAGNASWKVDPIKAAVARSSLRLLDAHDARSIGSIAFPALAPLPGEIDDGKPVVQIKVDSERLPLKIDPSEAKQLRISITYTGSDSSQALLELTFNPDVLSVKNAQDGQPLRPG
jgi:hypothetical protein